MNKTLKILLGLLTVWPFAYLILFFITVFSTVFFVTGPEGGAGPPPLIALILPLHLLTMLLIFALMTFYIVNVFRNSRVEKDQKVLWAVVLFFGSMIAMPIYWYIYIWKAAPPAVPAPPSQLAGADTSAWTNEASSSRSEQREYVPPTSPPNWRE